MGFGGVAEIFCFGFALVVLFRALGWLLEVVAVTLGVPGLVLDFGVVEFGLGW